MIHIERVAPPAGLPPGATAERVLREQYHRQQARRERAFLRERGIRDPQLDGYLDRLDRQAAIAVDGTPSGSGVEDGVSSKATGSITIAANSWVVACAKWEVDSRTPTFSGGGVSSWSYLAQVSNGAIIRVGYGKSSGNTGAITANFGSSTSWVEVCAMAFSGLDSTDAYDDDNFGTGTTNPATCAAATNSVADAVYISLWGAFAGTNSSSFLFGGVSGTEDVDGDTLCMGHLIVASTASRNAQVTLSGAPDYAGAVLVLKGAAAGGTLFTQSVGGSISPAGALVRQTRKAHAGFITPSGTVTRRAGKALAGSVTPAGGLTKRTGKALAGSITPAGALAAVRTILVFLSGSITPVGTLVRQTGKGLGGVLAPVGSLVKRTARALGGSITPVGAVVGIRTILVYLTGSLTPAGALVRQTSKALAGSLTPAGALTKRIGKALGGTLTPVGGLVKRVGKALSGALGLVGSVLGVKVPGGGTPAAPQYLVAVPAERHTVGVEAESYTIAVPPRRAPVEVDET